MDTRYIALGIVIGAILAALGAYDVLVDGVCDILAAVETTRQCVR